MATPEFSLQTGNRCSACHVNFQGSGMRNDFGRLFGKDIALINNKELGFTMMNNDHFLIEDLLALGGDVRYNSFRSHKSDDSQRKYFFMQAAFNTYLELSDWFNIHAQYNFGPKVFRGQQEWNAVAVIRPREDLPSLRFGFFEPAIGMRSPNHMNLDRQIASTNGIETLLAPNFAEYGVELNYESLEWLTSSIGIFKAESLSELQLFGGQSNLIDIKDNPSALLRVVFWPSNLIEGFNDSFIGATYFKNYNFNMLHTFVGIALLEDLFLQVKLTTTEKEDIRETFNYSTELRFSPIKGLYTYVRAEEGTTTLSLLPSNPKFKNKQAILGFNTLLIPNFELITEYRFLETEEYGSMRWMVQLHFYY